MFNPTQPFRRWHRHVNTNQKRYAVASAVAASALPALVMARGHIVSEVPEFPLVVDSNVQSITKTKDAKALLESVGAYDDVVKAKNSKQLRSGKGKMRNRRYTHRKGPLIVFAEDEGLTRAFRNLPGVDVANVERLNLLQLAPGGHLGRFIVWTAQAFAKANAVFGTTTTASTTKNGYKLPQNVMTNSDLTRIINSDEVQAKVNPTKLCNNRKHNRQKKNPLKNFGVMVRLNPYAMVQKRARILASKAKSDKTAKKLAAKKHAATQKANKARLLA
jgi:large subunit ribosomal protein L4e